MNYTCTPARICIRTLVRVNSEHLLRPSIRCVYVYIHTRYKSPEETYYPLDSAVDGVLKRSLTVCLSRNSLRNNNATETWLNAYNIKTVIEDTKSPFQFV